MKRVSIPGGWMHHPAGRIQPRSQTPSTRRHPDVIQVFLEYSSLLSKTESMCDSDVTTEDEVPQTVTTVTVSGSLLL